MASTAIDRLDGLSSSAAIKGPCRAATTANISLYGLQTIDGVALAQDDRVLVKNQTAPSENGVYVVDTGQWRRSKDFLRTTDVVEGTQVLVTDGSTYPTSLWCVTSQNPIDVGTDSITFAQTISSSVEIAAAVAAAEAAAATAEAAELVSAAAAVAAAASAADAAATTLTTIQAAPAKSSLADADRVTILDSAASLALKYVTWAILKVAAFVQASVDVASATTTDIGAAASFFVRITGTTTITSLGTASTGTLRLVKFEGALTLTNNANIVVPTGANITTAANDFFLAVSEGSGVWRIILYRGALVTSDWTTGTKTTPGMITPAQLAAAITALGGSTTPFVSSQQTITAAGALTLAHGLGARPTIFQAELVCTTAENGYSINDIVPLMAIDFGDTSRGCVITADATNVYVRYGSTATTFALPNKTTGTGAALTNSSWRLVIRAKLS